MKNSSNDPKNQCIEKKKNAINVSFGRLRIYSANKKRISLILFIILYHFLLLGAVLISEPFFNNKNAKLKMAVMIKTKLI